MKNKKTEYKAVVTGATRGIGFAIAEKLLADGMKVVATGTHQNQVALTAADINKLIF